jgi:hypothetical protein
MTGVTRESFSVLNNRCYGGDRASKIPDLCMTSCVFSTAIQTAGRSSVLYCRHFRKCNTVHTRCLYVRASLYTTEGDTYFATAQVVGRSRLLTMAVQVQSLVTHVEFVVEQMKEWERSSPNTCAFPGNPNSTKLSIPFIYHPGPL